MAAQSRNLYQYLINALSYKYSQLKNGGKIVTEYPYKGHNYPFNPLIFKWARKILPQRYVRDAGSDNDVYLNLVGESLLHNRDPELEEFANPDTLIEEPEAIHQQFEQDLETSQANEPVSVGAASTSSGLTATAIPHFRAPSLPQMPTQPDIGNIPTTPSTPEIRTEVPEVFQQAFADKPLDHLDPTSSLRASAKQSSPELDKTKIAASSASGGTPRNDILRNFKLPKVPEGLATPMKRFIKRMATPENLAKLFTGGLGGFLGGVITRSPLGVILGGGLGVGLTSWIKRNGGEGLLKIGGKIGKTGGNFLTGLNSKTGANSLARNPFARKSKWAILLFILGIGFMAMFLIGSAPPGTGTPSTGTGGGFGGNQNNVLITKTGDASVGNGQPINYTMTVKYTGTGLADIEVSDTIPDNTVSSEGTPSGTLVKWNLTGVSSGQSRVVRLTVIPQVEDIWVVNTGATATIKGVASTGTGGIASNISSCLFTRGDRTPPAKKYTSSVLLSAFADASSKTSVPAEVLAAVSRVETPGSSDWSDEYTQKLIDDATFSSQQCPQSGDGALGIMQLIPQFSHRTDAICRSCLARGASYIGKTVDQLTREDFCNPKTSTLLGAGFILEKLRAGYNLGDGTKWDPAWTNNQTIINNVARSFYGCLGYPSCSSGPHNYGNDLWNSINQCKI